VILRRYGYGLKLSGQTLEVDTSVIAGLSPSDATPQPLGTATPGVSTAASRGDHVHAMPTAANVGAVPTTRTVTGTTPVTVNGDNAAHDLSANLTLTTIPADASNPGHVTTGAQTFAGTKTYAGGIILATAKQVSGAAELNLNAATGQPIALQINSVEKARLASDGSLLIGRTRAAGAGCLGLPNAKALVFANNTDAADINAIGVDASHNLSIGQSTVTGVYVTAAAVLAYALGGQYHSYWVANNFTFGQGASGASATPGSPTFQAVDGNGTNIAGGNWTLRAGNGTGSGAQSVIIFQTPTVGSSGTAAQVATQRMRLGAGVMIGTIAADPGAGCIGVGNTFAYRVLSLDGTTWRDAMKLDASNQLQIGNGVNASFVQGSSIGLSAGGGGTVTISQNSTCYAMWNGVDTIFGAGANFDANGASATDAKIRQARRSGADQACSNLILQSQLGTGAGAVGYVSLQAPLLGTTGSTQHVAAESFRAYGTHVRVMAGYVRTPTATKTTTFTVNVGESYVPVDSTGGVTFTGTLPLANAVPDGYRVQFKDRGGNCGVKNVTIAAAGSDTFEGGGTTYAINTAWGYVELESNGSNKWFIVG
jgi:hypothetical protein